jgi:hypothetical protein
MVDMGITGVAMPIRQEEPLRDIKPTGDPELVESVHSRPGTVPDHSPTPTDLPAGASRRDMMQRSLGQATSLQRGHSNAAAAAAAIAHSGEPTPLPQEEAAATSNPLAVPSMAIERSVSSMLIGGNDRPPSPSTPENIKTYVDHFDADLAKQLQAVYGPGMRPKQRHTSLPALADDSPQDLSARDDGVSPCLSESDRALSESGDDPRASRAQRRQVRKTNACLQTINAILVDYDEREAGESAQRLQDDIDRVNLQRDIDKHMNELDTFEILLDQLLAKQQRTDELDTMFRQREVQITAIRDSITNLGRRRHQEAAIKEWEMMLDKRERKRQQFVAKRAHEVRDASTATVTPLPDMDDPADTSTFNVFGGGRRRRSMRHNSSSRGDGSPDDLDDSVGRANRRRDRAERGATHTARGSAMKRSNSPSDSSRKATAHIDRAVAREYLIDRKLKYPQHDPPEQRVVFVRMQLRQPDIADAAEKETSAFLNATLRMAHLVIGLCDEHGGYLVDATRSSFDCAFCNEEKALEYAIAVQSKMLLVDWSVPMMRFRGTGVVMDPRVENKFVFRGLRLAVGIHVTEVDNNENGNFRLRLDRNLMTHRAEYSGPCSHVAKQLADIARGGEILISQPAWNLMKANASLVAYSCVSARDFNMGFTEHEVRQSSLGLIAADGADSNQYVVPLVQLIGFEQLHRRVLLGNVPGELGNVYGALPDASLLLRNVLPPAAPVEGASRTSPGPVLPTVMPTSPSNVAAAMATAASMAKEFGVNLKPLRPAMDTTPATFVVATIPDLGKILLEPWGWHSRDLVLSIYRRCLDQVNTARVFTSMIPTATGDAAPSLLATPEYANGGVVSHSFDETVLMFRTDALACQWALTVQDDLRHLRWPDTVNAFYSPAFAEGGDAALGDEWNGIRVSMGISTAVPDTSTHRPTGLWQYDGIGLLAARELSICARGGEVLIPNRVLETITLRGIPRLDFVAKCINPVRSSKESKIYGLYIDYMAGRHNLLGVLRQDKLVKMLANLNAIRIANTERPHASAKAITARSMGKSLVSDRFLVVARKMCGSNVQFDSLMRSVHNGNVTEGVAEQFLALLHSAEKVGKVHASLLHDEDHAPQDFGVPDGAGFNHFNTGSSSALSLPGTSGRRMSARVPSARMSRSPSAVALKSHGSMSHSAVSNASSGVDGIDVPLLDIDGAIVIPPSRTGSFSGKANGAAARADAEAQDAVRDAKQARQLDQLEAAVGKAAAATSKPTVRTIGTQSVTNKNLRRSAGASAVPDVTNDTEDEALKGLSARDRSRQRHDKSSDERRVEERETRWKALHVQLQDKGGKKRAGPAQGDAAAAAKAYHAERRQVRVAALLAKREKDEELRRVKKAQWKERQAEKQRAMKEIIQHKIAQIVARQEKQKYDPTPNSMHHGPEKTPAEMAVTLGVAASPEARSRTTAPAMRATDPLSLPSPAPSPPRAATREGSPRASGRSTGSLPSTADGGPRPPSKKPLTPPARTLKMERRRIAAAGGASSDIVPSPKAGDGDAAAVSLSGPAEAEAGAEPSEESMPEPVGSGTVVRESPHAEEIAAATAEAMQLLAELEGFTTASEPEDDDDDDDDYSNLGSDIDDLLERAGVKKPKTKTEHDDDDDDDNDDDDSEVDEINANAERHRRRQRKQLVDAALLATAARPPVETAVIGLQCDLGPRVIVRKVTEPRAARQALTSNVLPIDGSAPHTTGRHPPQPQPHAVGAVLTAEAAYEAATVALEVSRLYDDEEMPLQPGERPRKQPPPPQQQQPQQPQQQAVLDVDTTPRNFRAIAPSKIKRSRAAGSDAAKKEAQPVPAAQRRPQNPATPHAAVPNLDVASGDTTRTASPRTSTVAGLPGGAPPEAVPGVPGLPAVPAGEAARRHGAADEEEELDYAEHLEQRQDVIAEFRGVALRLKAIADELSANRKKWGMVPAVQHRAASELFRPLVHYLQQLAAAQSGLPRQNTARTVAAVEAFQSKERRLQQQDATAMWHIGMQRVRIERTSKKAMNDGNETTQRAKWAVVAALLKKLGGAKEVQQELRMRRLLVLRGCLNELFDSRVEQVPQAAPPGMRFKPMPAAQPEKKSTADIVSHPEASSVAVASPKHGAPRKQPTAVRQTTSPKRRAFNDVAVAGGSSNPLGGAKRQAPPPPPLASPVAEEAASPRPDRAALQVMQDLLKHFQPDATLIPQVLNMPPADVAEEEHSAPGVFIGRSAPPTPTTALADDEMDAIADALPDIRRPVVDAPPTARTVAAAPVARVADAVVPLPPISSRSPPPVDAAHAGDADDGPPAPSVAAHHSDAPLLGSSYAPQHGAAIPPAAAAAAAPPLAREVAAEIPVAVSPDAGAARQPQEPATARAATKAAKHKVRHHPAAYAVTAPATLADHAAERQKHVAERKEIQRTGEHHLAIDTLVRSHGTAAIASELTDNPVAAELQHPKTQATRAPEGEYDDWLTRLNHRIDGHRQDITHDPREARAPKTNAIVQGDDPRRPKQPKVISVNPMRAKRTTTS